MADVTACRTKAHDAFAGQTAVIVFRVQKVLEPSKAARVPTDVLMNYLAVRRFSLFRCKEEFQYVHVFIFSFMVFSLKRAAVIRRRTGERGRNACGINHL